jgi:hypothetical protein
MEKKMKDELENQRELFNRADSKESRIQYE